MPSGRSERAQRKGNLKNGFGKVETRFEEEMTKHNRSVWFDQSIRSPCSYGAVKSFQVRLDKTRLHRLVLSEAWRRNTTYLKKKHVFVHANILVMLWKLLFLCRCLEITKKGRKKSSWHRKGTGGEKNNHSWCAKDPRFLPNRTPSCILEETTMQKNPEMCWRSQKSGSDVEPLPHTIIPAAFKGSPGSH